MLVLFTATIVLASALLFMVQPMVGKMILPRGGGSPQVWMATLVFFQAALLAGYAYAHGAVRTLGTRRQSWVHVGVLLLPLLVLPLGLPGGGRPEGVAPSWWILGLLAAGIGIPFVVLAASSPLLQAWLGATDHPDAGDPYFLYAGSNVGSLVGLLCYPFLLEPLLPVPVQTRLWTAGYALLVALMVVCGWWARRTMPAEGRVQVEPPTDSASDGPAQGRPTWADRGFWLFAAAVPSALLLGVTHYLTSRIAPVPLLWVVPLALYLLTFIAAFARRRWVSTAAVSRVFPILAVGAALLLLLRIRSPLLLTTLVHLAVLTVAGLLCHLRLADRRPAARHLTGFYLWVSLGGVLGGSFAALLAPLLFDSIAEYPTALALAAFLLLPRSGDADRTVAPADLVGPALLLAYLLVGGWVAGRMEGVSAGVVSSLFIVVPVGAAFLLSQRPVAFGLALAVVFGLVDADRMYRGDVLFKERTFFGTYHIVRDPARTFHVLYHGSAVHGMEALEPGVRGEPLAYYHRTGPAGRIVRALAAQPDKDRLALVGAGTGALAAHAGAHQTVTLYEIDPLVLEIARDPRWFSFLEETPASVEMVVGDGRLQLEAREERYDLLVLDAFTSGSIPIHLMTREAVELYMDRLRPGGALLFHVSNAYLELAPVLGAHARDLGLVAYETVDPRAETETGILGSHWVILVRQPADLEGLPGQGWRPLSAPPGLRAWTDDFSDLLTAQRWF